MPKKFNIKTFLELNVEEQAKEIEKQTQELIKRLPRLKKELKMYGEVSSELYNLSEEEVKLMSSTYASAVRGGEITTPTSKRAYQKFISDLRKYSRSDINYISTQTALKRFESWKENIRNNSTQDDIDYMEELTKNMTNSQIRSFTTSEYFLDVNNWSSEDFLKETDDGLISVSVLKLELFLNTYDKGQTRNLYNKNIATDGKDIMRGAYKGKRAKKRQL